MQESDVLEPRLPTLEEMQQWTQVLGRAQQLMLEQAAGSTGQTLPFDPAIVARIQTSFADEGLALWQRFLDAGGLLRDRPDPAPETSPAARKDRRFADPAWTEHPFYDLIRQSYLLLSDYLMKLADAVDGVDPRQKAKLRFATTGLLDAIAPSNFPLTNPLVVQKTIESGGENLVTGLKHMLADMEKGQLTHTDGTKFELGRNIAATPGKVIHETPLYQLIHYAPSTAQVLETPLIIFPPWINRFYILDLSPEKSFVKWAVDQGISVFLVSWKSADASMKDLIWDDYIIDGQIDAIDTVRDLLGVESVHAIGYCVAGTTLAATLALLAARGEADKVASATFFTAQVDFSQAGDLSLFVDDDQMKLVEQLSSQGFLDGRYMAATFNMLRGTDLIWNYVVNNYLLGEDYAPFDLLYWNADVTNLPGQWHLDYLRDLYRDNMLVRPGAMKIAGERIDLIMIPKVGCAGDLYAVDALVTAIERAKGRSKPLGFEVIIESAAGISHVEAVTLHFFSRLLGEAIHLRHETIVQLQQSFIVFGPLWLHPGSAPSHRLGGSGCLRTLGDFGAFFRNSSGRQWES